MKFHIPSTKPFMSFEFSILKLFVIWNLWFVILAALWFAVLGINEADAAIIGKPPTNLGLVGYWSMNEGTGSYAGDSSGNKNQGTLTNGPTWVDGKRGKALNFDGVDDYVNLPVAAAPPTTGHTVSAWFRSSKATMGDIFGTRTTQGAHYMAIAISDTTNCSAGKLSYLTRNSSGAQQDLCSQTTVYNDNQWHQVVVTFSSPSSKTLYIDGVLDGTASQTWIPGTLERVAIGSRGIGDVQFTGLIDEVRVYNRALGAGEIQALYNSGAAKISKTSIAFDNSVTASSLSASTLTSDAFTIAPTASYLYIGIAISAGNTVTSVKAGVTGTEYTLIKLDSVEGSIRAEYWYMVLPPTGSIKVQVNLGSATEVAFGASSYKGVNITTPHGTQTKASNDSSTSISVTVGSAIGELVVDSFAANAAGSGSPSSPQTQRWSVSSGSNRDSRGSEKDGAASVAMTYTSGSGHHGLIAVPLKPARKSTIKPPSNTGLVGYWSFDDGAGISATDFSGKNNAGLLTNGPTWVAGKRGKALNFDGTDDYVDAGSASSLDNLGPVTVSAWIYPRSIGEGGYGRIVDKASGFGTGGVGKEVPTGGWTFQLLNYFGVNQLQFAVNCGSLSTVGWNTSPSGSITLNKWQHVVATLNDRSANCLGSTKIKLYINGARSDEGYSDSMGSPVSDGTENVIIGNDKSGARTFNGLIDDVRIYNRTLSAAEVQALYNSR